MAIDWTAAFTNAAKFAPLATSIIAFVAVCFTATGVAIAWRSHREKTLAEFWRDFDKISIQYPELGVAGLVGEFDFKALVLDGSQEKFARYVWYVSYLCFCIEQTIHLRGQKEWQTFFDNQILVHRRFLSSVYCQTTFLPALSEPLRRSILQLSG